MCGIKIPQYEFALKMQGGGGAYARGGAYLRDTTVHSTKCYLLFVGGLGQLCSALPFSVGSYVCFFERGALSDVTCY